MQENFSNPTQTDNTKKQGKYVRSFTGELPYDINKEGDYYFASQRSMMVSKYLKGYKGNIEHYTWIILMASVLMGLWHLPYLGTLVGLLLFGTWAIGVWVGVKMIKTPPITSYDTSWSTLEGYLKGHWSFKESVILSVMSIAGALCYGMVGWIVTKMTGLVMSSGGSGLVFGTVLALICAPALLGLWHVVSMPYIMSVCLVFFHNVSALDALTLSVRSMSNQRTWVLHQAAALSAVGALLIIPATLLGILAGWVGWVLCAPMLGYIGFMSIDLGLYNYRHFLMKKKWVEEKPKVPMAQEEGSVSAVPSSTLQEINSPVKDKKLKANPKPDMQEQTELIKGSDGG